MQQEHETSVVKTIFFRNLSSNGKVEVNIDQKDADLSSGRWRFCLESLVIAPIQPLDAAAVTVSINTNTQHLRINDDFGNSLYTAAPARIGLAVLTCPVGGKSTVFPISKQWLEMSRPCNSIRLDIQMAKDDQLISGSITGIMSIARILHS
jgi:hypothetical protein